MQEPGNPTDGWSPRLRPMGSPPLVAVLKGYRREDFLADVRASLPVAAVALPQSMAFAMLAGFPPAYGAWTAIVAGLVASCFGSSRQLVTCLNNAVCMLVASLFAVLARQHVGEFDPAAAIVVFALLVGLFEIGMGLVGMGELARFISGSVLQGFMLGTALLIALHELGPLLGLHTQGAEPLLLIENLIRHLPDARPAAVAVGLGTMLLMVVVPRLNRHVPGAFVALLGAALVVWLLRIPADQLPMAQAVPAVLPSLATPNVSLDLFRDLVPAAMAAAILGAVEALVISGALATKTGQDVDSRWQLVGQGLANMGCGLLRGLPCSSSFTRSFLNLQEGARTQLAAMFAALWILFVVLLLGPLVQHVPQACLAGVLIVLAWRLPDWRRIKTMLRATPSDRAALLITFAATLVVRLDTALYVGVFVSLALFLRKAQTPHLVEYALGPTRRMRQIERPGERTHPAICMLHVEGDLFFAAAEAFEKEVRRVAHDPALKVIVLRMRNARNLDATSALTLGNLASWLRARGQRLLVSGVSGDADRILERSGVIDVIGRENVFFSDKSILTSTRDALLAAQRLVGATEVRILHAEDEEGWESDAATS